MLSFKGLSEGKGTDPDPMSLCVQAVVQGRWYKLYQCWVLVVPTPPEPIANIECLANVFANALRTAQTLHIVFVMGMSRIICSRFATVFANALLLALPQHIVFVLCASLQVLHVTIM